MSRYKLKTTGFIIGINCILSGIIGIIGGLLCLPCCCCIHDIEYNGLDIEINRNDN